MVFTLLGGLFAAIAAMLIAMTLQRGITNGKRNVEKILDAAERQQQKQG